MKMLMEIDPVPMRGSLVMTMMMISPSRREVFPGRIAPPEPQIGSAKVPPRGGGVSSREFAYDFFLNKRLHIAKDGHHRAARGPTRKGSAPPTLVDGGWPPSGISFARYFLLIPKMTSVEF